MSARTFAEEAAPHADAIAIGDGVQTWPQILADVEAGSLRPRYAATFERPYQQDPAPRRDLLPRGSFVVGFDSDRKESFVELVDWIEANRLWRFLIKRGLVHRLWSPLVELTRRRHASFRKRLAAIQSNQTVSATAGRAQPVVPAGG